MTEIYHDLEWHYKHKDGVVALLENQIEIMHGYVEMKFAARDYHAVIDGCIDLQLLSRELEVWRRMQ